MGKETIHVVGGGLVGSLMAVFLARRGFKVELYDGRPDMRRADISAGRSINLVVTSRGLQALEKVDLMDKVLEIAVPMEGRMLHDVQGKTTFVPYGQKQGEVINAVSRGLLNCLLLDAAESYENISLHFEKRCVDYDLEKKELHFDGQGPVKAPIVIGADGAFSAVRKAMLNQVMNFNYAQDFLEHGYKELTIPAAADGGFLMEKHALHIWPRGQHMLIALPNTDGSFTCTLFFPYEGKESFASLKSEREVAEFFRKTFPDALEIMPTLIEDFMQNPVGSLVTVRCAPWNVDGQAALIGDAAHAIVPFFGQGMNCGFEDCSVLDGLIGEAGENPDWNKVFSAYHEARKPNAEAIADMALENFIEMRDTTANPKFQLKKQIGFELEKRYPERFIPRYSMVMFHPEVSYSEAKRRSEAQDVILEKLCANISDATQTDWQQAEQLLSRAS